LEVAILGGGTTLAVLAFCSLPVIALVRSGFRLRPRFQLRNPLLRSLAVEGSWAALFLAATQVVQFVVLRQSNRVAGGTNVYQFAFILFTLPYSLFAVPVMTTRFPQMSGAALHRRWDEFAEITRGAVRSILFTGFLAGAVTAAVALPVARMLTVSTDATMAARIGEATVAFAPAVVGYGLVLFFTRAFYAVGDPRTPALINVVLAGLAAVLMGFGASQLSDRNLVTGLAAAFAVTYVIGSIVMAWLLAQRLNGEGVTGLRTLRGPVLRGLVAATLAGAAGWGVVRLIGFDSRVEAAVSVAAGGVVVLALFLATQAGTGGPGVRLAVRTLGAGEPASRENRVSR
jgi:putative peptidoglycan lipid II flippase